MVAVEGFAVSIIFLLAASYYDLFNKRTIPDWLSYSFIAIAIAFSLVMEGFVLLKFAAAAAIFILGYIVYRLGYIGGADVFFITALTLLLPLMAGGTPTIIAVLLISAVLMALYLELSFFSRRSEFRPGTSDILTSIVWLIGYGAVAYLMYSIYLDWLGLLAVVVGIVSAIFALIKRDLTKSLVAWVKPGEIIEEDILAVEEMDPKLIERLKLERLLTKKQIAKLKKAGVKKIAVYSKLPPYLPFILLGVLGSIALVL